MPAGGLTFNKEFPTLVPKAKVKGSQRTARRGKIKANEIKYEAKGPLIKSIEKYEKYYIIYIRSFVKYY